jgi:hypothetical protein
MTSLNSITIAAQTSLTQAQTQRIQEALTPAKMAYVDLNSLIDYNEYTDSKEWAFIIKHHSYKHTPSGPMEYVFNVEIALSITVHGTDEEQPPEVLRLIFAKAFTEGYHYIIFHQGC